MKNSLEDVTLIILHALLSREDVNIPWAMDKALEMARIFEQIFKEETK